MHILDKGMLPVIGLPGGKLQKPTHKFLADAGVDIEDYDPSKNSRNYIIRTKNAIFVIDSSRDIVKRISLGGIDLAILGSEAIVEFKAERSYGAHNKANIFRHEVKDLEVTTLPHYLSWRLAILANSKVQDADFKSLLERLVNRDKKYHVHSWTEYPYTQKEMMEQTSSNIEVGIYPHSAGEITIFPSRRSTESKLAFGVDSLFGLELVSTGETARANNLREFAETSQTHGPVLVRSPEFTNDGYAQEFVGRLLNNQSLMC